MKYLKQLSCLLTLFLTTTGISAQTFWGSTNKRYLHKPQELERPETEQTLRLRAWQGEVLNAQLITQNKTQAEQTVEFVRLGKLLDKHRKALKLCHTEIGYVDQVLADTFSGCGTHDVERYGRFPEADRLTGESRFTLPKQEQRGVWLTMQVAPDNRAGVYTGYVELKVRGRKVQRLALSVEVLPHRLPEARDWRFHLDFWQNPYAVARWHKVELWSDKHFETMRPYMKRLARSGQKVITATLINKPWDGQTEDPFGSMIQWTKGRDGSWSYDYSIFDRWVSFMHSVGIDREITCFSMIPWRLSFDYWDEATSSVKAWQSKPGESLYEERWGHFLRDFSRHLGERGWLGKTTIAMDERSMAQMQAAIALIKRYAPEIKISMAGNYHPEIEADLIDYSVDYMSREQPTAETIAHRHKAGKKTSYYTCCSAGILNTFTFSPPAEAELIPWYALSRGLDGYLRWAYNSWTKNPNVDSRFRAWSAGDTYIVYPDNKSSVRWQKLLEGIQQFEKYHILRIEAEHRGDRQRLKELERLLSLFDVGRIREADAMARSLKDALNTL